jgi:hypothetical protein
LSPSARERRSLPGIDFNDAGQLSLIELFGYAAELRSFPMTRGKDGEFFYNNGTFEAGDAEFYYSVIRQFRSATVVEIGAGYSSLIAARALAKNQQEAGDYRYRHICIEPHENPWLESIGAEVIRLRLEDVDRDMFRALRMNDILFIDSSHVIRPQGEVLIEYLEILPQLQRGVLVHIHDVFTPRDYPNAWVIDEVRLWNEQYLVEAFLTGNSRFRVIGALNYLKHKYPQQLYRCFPVLAANPSHEPGSLWLQVQ